MMPKLLKTVRFRKHPILYQMKQMRLNQYPLFRRMLNLSRRKTAQKGRAMNSYPSRNRFLTHRLRNLKNAAVSGEQLNPERMRPLLLLLPGITQKRMRKALPVKMMIMKTMISA